MKTSNLKLILQRREWEPFYIAWTFKKINLETFVATNNVQNLEAAKLFNSEIERLESFLKEQKEQHKDSRGKLVTFKCKSPILHKNIISFFANSMDYEHIFESIIDNNGLFLHKKEIIMLNNSRSIFPKVRTHTKKSWEDSGYLDMFKDVIRLIPMLVFQDLADSVHADFKANVDKELILQNFVGKMLQEDTRATRDSLIAFQLIMEMLKITQIPLRAIRAVMEPIPEY